MNETGPGAGQAISPDLEVELTGRAAAAHHDVACALGCGRHGPGPHFIRDLRMRGVLVRAEADRLPWFVCEPCRSRHGESICCLRCGGETRVVVGSAGRCADCGQLT
jgi:hypothetical protein